MLLVVWAAYAGDPVADWKSLYEARFLRLADGSPENAATLYRATLQDRTPQDPLYASTAYWLGRAQLELGDLLEARATLAAAAADPPASATSGAALYGADVATRDAARALLEEIALRTGEVRSLPARWDFESGSFPAVRGWAGLDSGDLRVVDEGAGRALSWSTVHAAGVIDRLTVRFGEETPPPRTFSFRVHAREGDVAVRVVGIDEWGLGWTSGLVPVPLDGWADVRVDLAELDAPALAPGPAALGRVIDLRIEVLPTGPDARGRATVLIDDVLAG